MPAVFPSITSSELKSRWGWFVAFGILMLICGVLAFGDLLIVTVVSVFYVGILMLAGGIIYLIHAFQVRGWEHVLFWALSGLLYVVAGIAAFINPILTSAILTLLLAVALIAAGIFRIWISLRMRPVKGWGWILLAGLVTALAGVVIASGWPVNSLWILGLFLAVDLIVQGWALVAFGLGIRNA